MRGYCDLRRLNTLVKMLNRSRLLNDILLEGVIRR